jgi:hypothetical protein
MPFVRSYASGGGGGGVAFDTGVQVPSGDINAVLYVNASGNLATSSDDAAIGATPVKLGYLAYAEHIADHVYLGHVDANTSSTVFQVDMRQGGDLVLKSPVASGAITYVAGISGNGSHNFLVNGSTSRMVLSNTGIGVFGTTPAARSTGWAAITNPVSRKTFDTTTVTLPQLAEFVGTLSEQLKLHGWIST